MPSFILIDRLALLMPNSAELSSCDPNASPPYIHMPGNGHLLLNIKYLPEDGTQDPYEVYLRKPGSMRGAERYKLLSHLYARQQRYLAGEKIFIFRWLSFKAPGKKLAWLPAKYDTEWMIKYATEHGKIVTPVDLGAQPAPVSTPAPEAGPSRLAKRKGRRTRGQPSPSDEDSDTSSTSDDDNPFRDGAGEDEEEELDDDEVIAGLVDDEDYGEDEEDFTNQMAQISAGYEEDGDEEDEDDGRRAANGAVKGKGKNPVRPPMFKPLSLLTVAKPIPPPVLSRTGMRSAVDDNSDEEESDDDELDRMLKTIRAPLRALSPTVDISTAPPNWTRNLRERKLQFLRAITTDSQYRLLVDWYAPRMVVLLAFRMVLYNADIF